MSSIADVAVIGLGMFGAATAKYLAYEGASVVGIGPREPTKDEAVNQHSFAAHYDEARICRRLGWDPVWAYLDARSLERFRPMEDQSGISFFEETGSLILMATSIRHRTEKIIRQAAEDGVPVERLSDTALEGEFPRLGLPNILGGVEGLLERDGAGLLNPRKLVAAQVALASTAGIDVARGAATLIERHRNVWRVHVDDGTGQKREVLADKLLLATGALSNYSGLLPQHQLLAMQPYTEPNLMFEVEEEQAGQAWQLPPIVTVDPEDTGHANRSTYLVPPVRYPDGRWYARVGPGMQPFVTRLSTLPEIIDWYQNQRVTDIQHRYLTDAMQELVPTMRLPKARHATCIVEKTITGYPYIGEMNDGLFIAVGGNGHGARGSDEIGRLAAMTLLGRPTNTPLADDTFTPMLASAPEAVWKDSAKLKPPFGLC